jgi:hypothetical protein
MADANQLNTKPVGTELVCAACWSLDASTNATSIKGKAADQAWLDASGQIEDRAQDKSDPNHGAPRLQRKRDLPGLPHWRGSQREPMIGAVLTGYEAAHQGVSV